jgi:6-phosphogluconolactonase (cycloisomerase 2 family)
MTNKRVVGKFAALVLSLLVSIAPARAAFLYVANPNAGIVGFSIDSTTGGLTQVPGSPYQEQTYRITADPNGQFLFETEQINVDTSLRVYSIGPDGSLQFLAAYPGGSGDFVAADPAGTFVYVASAYGQSIFGYQIGSDGTLTAVPNSPFATGPAPFLLGIEPIKNFMYVAASAGTTPPGGPPPPTVLTAYQIAIDGSLTTQPPMRLKPPKVPYYAIGTDPNGKFLYGAVNAHDISGFTIGAEGGLSPISHSIYSFRSGPVELLVDPTGRYLYVTDFYQYNVLAFSINASTGALKPIPGSPFVAGVGPYTLGIDPTDTFLYVANNDGDSISGYRINEGGGLTALPGSPFGLPPNAAPGDLVIVP